MNRGVVAQLSDVNPYHQECNSILDKTKSIVTGPVLEGRMDQSRAVVFQRGHHLGEKFIINGLL